MSVKNQLTVYCGCCGKERKVLLNSPIGNLSYCKKCSRIVKAECIICYNKFETPYYKTVGGYVCPHCASKHRAKIKFSIQKYKDVLKCLNSIDDSSIFRYANLKMWILENKKIMNQMNKIIELVVDYPQETSNVSVFAELTKKMVLIEHEAEIFECIQQQLLDDIKTENNENLAYWKQVLQIISKCKTVIEQDNVGIECYFNEFPIAKSCCSAINELISDIEIRKHYCKQVECTADAG